MYSHWPMSPADRIRANVYPSPAWWRYCLGLLETNGAWKSSKERDVLLNKALKARGWDEVKKYIGLKAGGDDDRLPSTQSAEMLRQFALQRGGWFLPPPYVLIDDREQWELFAGMVRLRTSDGKRYKEILSAIASFVLETDAKNSLRLTSTLRDAIGGHKQGGERDDENDAE